MAWNGYCIKMVMFQSASPDQAVGQLGHPEEAVTQNIDQSDSPNEEFQPRSLLLISKLFKFMPAQTQLGIHLSAPRLGVCAGAVPPMHRGQQRLAM
jgi:hypothetical protein